MIRFAHVPESALRSAGLAVRSAVPVLSRADRHLAARRLSQAARSGTIPRGALRDLLKTSGDMRDAPFVRIASNAARRLRRTMSPLPRLPDDLRAPADPAWMDPKRREHAASWLRVMVEAGWLPPAQLSRCLHSLHDASDVVRSSIDQLVQSSVDDLLRQIGIAPDSSDVRLWSLVPAFLTGVEQDRGAELIVDFAHGEEQFAVMSQLRADDYGFVEFCRAFETVRLPTLALILPQEVCSEGVLGSYFFTDVEAYVEDAVGQDGTITLSDDLLEHLESEYGMEVTNGEAREGIERLIRFLATKATTFRAVKSKKEGVDLLRATAAAAPTPALQQCLGSLAELLALAPSRKDSGQVMCEALDEEACCAGTLVLVGDLSGMEGGALDDIYDHHMQTGSTMATILSAPDKGELLRVAVADAAFTTVLSTVLHQLSGAAHAR